MAPGQDQTRPRGLGVDASLILDTAHEAFVAMGVDGTVLEWNLAAEATFGWRREEALGQELADLIIPERLREAHRSGLARFLRTGEGPVLESRLELPAVRRDGSEVHVEITISAATAEQGQFFHAFLHDVSERVSRDRLLAAQLRVTEVLATTAPEHALDQVLEIICQEGGWRYIGLWMARDDAEQLHDYHAWWDTEAEDYAPFSSASRSAGFHRGRGLPGTVWLRREPVWHWSSETGAELPRHDIAVRSGFRSGLAVPLRAGNEVVAVLEFFTDDPRAPDQDQRSLLLTIAPQVGEYIARRRAEERSALEQDQFVAMVSHELRTPLTSITGFARTMLDLTEHLTEEQARQFIEIILAQGERLTRIVEDLLTMSRLQARGGISVDIGVVDVVEAVREVLDELGRAERFELRVHAPGITACADRDLCKQVVVNFIQNAERYGEPPYVIEVGGSETLVRVAVTDAGPGVPREFVPKLFERFSRAAEVNSQPGTGLGLAIVRAIADAQGGRVWHEPVSPTGARFVLELPRPSRP